MATWSQVSMFLYNLQVLQTVCLWNNNNIRDLLKVLNCSEHLFSDIIYDSKKKASNYYCNLYFFIYTIGGIDWEDHFISMMYQRGWGGRRGGSGLL